MKFTKLDLNQVYQQVNLDEKSKSFVHGDKLIYILQPILAQLVTLWNSINTWNLPCNVYYMESIDDTLVAGKNDEKHLAG